MRNNCRKRNNALIISLISHLVNEFSQTKDIKEILVIYFIQNTENKSFKTPKMIFFFKYSLK